MRPSREKVSSPEKKKKTDDRIRMYYLYEMSSVDWNGSADRANYRKTLFPLFPDEQRARRSQTFARIKRFLARRDHASWSLTDLEMLSRYLRLPAYVLNSLRIEIAYFKILRRCVGDLKRISQQSVVLIRVRFTCASHGERE